MCPSKRNQSKLDKLAATGSADEEVEVEEAPKRHGVLAGRGSALSRLASGKQKAVRQFMHDPERVRIWSEHDRDYAGLDSASCVDLIDGFKRTGQQEFAAIVRAIRSDDDSKSEFDYELICGARRHWTASHLGWDLLVEVRDLNDLQAFVLLDLENRDREDVSDHERAINYKRALPKFFENKRADMARHLDIDPSQFGKILDLADLPSWLVRAYRDRRDLKVHHGSVYKRLLTDADNKRRMRDATRGLAESARDGNSVFKALKKAAVDDAPRAKRSTRDRYGHLSVVEAKNGAATLKLPPAKKLKSKDVDGLRKSFEAFIGDYLKSQS